MHLIDKIQATAQSGHADVVGIRRHLHMYPELSFEEEKTAAYIADRLKEWGIPFTSGWAGHGLVAVLEGSGPGPTVALRADIDALPITEANEADYCSRNKGVMHACGHDVHSASLLGALHILWTLRSEWKGTVRAIFQPAEEKHPGGASLLIKEGVLENPRPTRIFGQHVLPSMPAGRVGFREGVCMASADELYLTIEGKGGHGAMPHLTRDPIAITATLISALQQIVSRNANPIAPSVLTFGRIWSDGGATNVIPDKVHVEGTFRALDEAWRAEAHHLLTTMCTGLTASMGATCHLEIRKGYPTLISDVATTRQAKSWAEVYLGQDAVEELDIRMGAEDFAYYSQVMPACFYRLGTGNVAKGITSGLHTPRFDVDETALEIGSGLMAWIAISQLSEQIA
ncbi:MAG: amidohydrolase [Saprospiraceae bacterium]|nr:amidohydrolase [Saprospiraceae bacterium]